MVCAHGFAVPLHVSVAETNWEWHSSPVVKVYVLHHVRADDAYGDDAKMIGVYSSEELALAATSRLIEQPGFRDYTVGFQIGAYDLDKDHWTEGFGPG